MIFIGFMANFTYDEIVKDKDRLTSNSNIAIEQNEISGWSSTGEWLSDIRRPPDPQKASTIDQITEPDVSEAPEEGTLNGSLSDIPLLDL